MRDICGKGGPGKDMVGPNIKNLVNNTYKHSMDLILVVTAAIIVYFTNHVKEPPPELFFTNPVFYVSQLKSFGGIVLAEFLRHGGLPTMFFKRAARAEDGTTMDDMHCLAFHLFRAVHKTSSTQISLLHLISIFAIHTYK